LVEKFGRRLIFCTGIDIMWLSCLLVGILGSIKGSSEAISNALVFATCLWGELAVIGRGFRATRLTFAA
jgi:hypothetical protein